MHESGQTSDVAGARAVAEPRDRPRALGATVLADLPASAGRDRSVVPAECNEYRVVRQLVTFALSESDPHAIACEATRIVAAELGGASAAIWRFDGDDARLVGEWGRAPRGRASAPAQMTRGGRESWSATYSAPDRDGPPAAPRRMATATAAAPLSTACGIWGAIAVSWQEPCTVDGIASDLLSGIAELVGAVVINAVDLARLTGDARDVLTGLPTEVLFRERVTQEAVRSRRHSHALTLVEVSVNGRTSTDGAPDGDDFDRVLRRVSRRLGRAARGGDILGRLDGDVFGWLLPYCELEGGRVATDRLRAEIAREQLPEGVSVSIGICDAGHVRDGDALMAAAADALGRARSLPGNATGEYVDPRPHGRPAAPEPRPSGRSDDIGTVYAMSRAVDARDPSMFEHSRRVADLAGHLARRLGWSTSSEVRLREAALLHDVGKVGVPDEILLKTTALTPDEYRIARTHAEIGAQIIAGILDDEQVLWVRHHQERLDGQGYPDGLSGDLIPDGARILGLADSWDSMTAGRPYRDPLPAADALSQCTALAGTQFCPLVVLTLVDLWESGAFIQGLGHLGAFE